MAKQAFDEALTIDPTDTYSMRLLIGIHQAVGDHKSAVIHSQDLLTIDPSAGIAKRTLKRYWKHVRALHLCDWLESRYRRYNPLTRFFMPDEQPIREENRQIISS